MSITVDQASLKQTVAALQTMSRASRTKHTRIGLNAAGGIIKRAAVANAPKRTKLLSRSQIVKVRVPEASKNPSHRDKPAYMLMGTSRAAVAPMANGKKLSIRKATKRVLGGGKVQAYRPSRIAHLAERKTHFTERAAQSAGPAAMAKLQEKLTQGINQEAAKLATK